MNKIFMVVLGLSICFSLFAEELKKVGIVRYKIPPHNFQETVDGFKNEMKKMGYTEGKNISYTELLTSTGDQSSSGEVTEFVKANKDKLDLILTLGWVGLPTREIIKDTKVNQVYNLVFRPFGEKITGTTLDKVSGSNITGIYLTFPPEKIVKLLKLIKPNAKKYAVIINSQIPADQFFKKWYEEATVAEKQGVEFVYFDLAQGVDKVFEDVKKGSFDAIGGGVGIRKAEAEKFFHMGIPLVTAKLDYLVQDKMKVTDEIIAHYNPFDAAGSQAAEIVNDIFKGKKPQEMLPQAVKKQIVIVNLDAAKRLGITIPTAILGQPGNIIIK